MSADKKPTVFLSYAREDGDTARRIFDNLTAAGADVWFDKEHLPAGSIWKHEIGRAIQASRYFVSLLSDRSVSKKGFVQRELSEAIELLSEYPDNEIYLIPARINECEPIHPKLKELSWLDLFPDWH